MDIETDAGLVGGDGQGRKWVPLFDGEKVGVEEVETQSIGAWEKDAARRERWREMEEEEEEEEEEMLGDEEGMDIGGFGGGMGGGGGGGGGGFGGGGGGMNAIPNTTTDDEFSHVVR